MDRRCGAIPLLAFCWACSSNNDPPVDGGLTPVDGGLHQDADVAIDAQPQPDTGVDERDGGTQADVSYNGDFEQDPNRVTLHGPCPQENRLGGFSVQMNENAGYTALDGVVRNGVIPNAVRDVTLEENGCRLLKRRRLICDPPCGSLETCSLDEVCVPAPVGQDMGPALFLGLVRPVELQPQSPGNTYFYTRLPHPGVLPGSVVQLTTRMPEYLVPLELYGVGVRQLVPRDARLVLNQGEPLVVHWEPPPARARSTVYLELNIDLHGLTPLLLTCDLPDTGTATVSATMIDGLIGGGVTGFPEARVTRRTMDSLTAAEGCVDFAVSSGREIDIEVTGFIPCARQQDCPSPLTCDLAIQQCR